MSKILIVGDLHIGKGVAIGRPGIGGKLNSRILDQLNLLEWILDRAHDELITDIILTGDVFEEPKPNPQLITLFISWLKKCQNLNLNVHIILGNHDFLRSGSNMISPLDIISEADLHGINIYKNITTLHLSSTSITLMPFRDRKFFSTFSNAEALMSLQDILDYELASIPVIYKKIVIGHLALEGSLPIGDEIDDLNNELFCPLNMFQGYDYVWMGHIHRYHILNKSPKISHIGSMDISNFGESEQKKYIVTFDCDTYEEKLIELPTRPLRKVNIAIPKDTIDTTQYVLDEIDKIKSEFEKSIVRVEVSLDDPSLKSIDKSIIEKYLVDKGSFNVTGISEHKKVALIKKDSANIIDSKMDVASAIKTYAKTQIEESKQEKFIQLSMEILNQYKMEAKGTI